MLRVPAGDDTLNGLTGALLVSNVYPGVSYRLDRALGAGSMAVAFLVERRQPTGTGVAVIKMARPEFVRAAAETALLTIRKESVALGRLNERVPPTPFVVRFIESGETEVQYGAQRLVLPWLALEYVHGDTLETRIERCVKETGFSFDPARAALCIEAIASGLDAVHSVDVLHRDIKPNNVLCCGTVPDEAFKISDFGVARPVGLRQTFMQGSMGTPGYASPEQILMDEKNIGPASDVFSLAATAYSIITGEELFVGDNVMKILELARDRKRRSIRDALTLCDELRARPSTCNAIDSAIALATAPDARDRPQQAGILGNMITSALRTDSLRGEPPLSRRRLTDRMAVRPSSTWNWKVRFAPGSDRAIRSVAWDAAGCCLAATTDGLAFWNGTDWKDVAIEREVALAVRSVHHVSPGVWLIGGDHGLMAYYAVLEGLQRLRRPRVSATFDSISGHPDDLCVATAVGEGFTPFLYGLSGKRWLRELPVPEAASLLGLARFDEERWIVAGRRRGGGAFAGLYSPLRWEVQPLPSPPIRTFTACAAVAEVGVGVVVGAEGRTLRINAGALEESIVPGEPDLSAVVVEPNQRAWTSSLGRMWVQTPQDPGRWTRAWEDQTWRVPIISLFADGRRVIGVAADGAVIEGCEY
ncbi:MAG TPA: serine/threonine-protein kinase [Polyangiaceae bacterium]|nr:serine/threonine-protein kinase [Polyangiaceae bacterium]